MDYLNRLSKTDVESICKLIGSRDLKQNFQTNSNGFSRIKPGFRPKTISDEEAVTLTVQNVTTRFIATVYKGNIIKNLIMDCQSYTKYRPNETTGGIFVSWRRKEELPTGA